jgi:hypothetical protein
LPISARVTDIGDGIEQLKAVNEAAAGLAAVRHREAAESAAMALARVLLRPLAAGWLFGPEISD